MFWNKPNQSVKCIVGVEGLVTPCKMSGFGNFDHPARAQVHPDVSPKVYIMSKSQELIP